MIEQQRSLVGKTLSTAPKADLSALFEAARREASPGGVAVVQVDEVSFELNDPLLRLLAAQSKERFEAYSAEAPSRGLVDESTVREKARRAAERRAAADAFERRRGEAVASLDAMALRAYQLRREASDLAGAIDEAQRADAAPAAPAAPAVPPAMGDETPPPPPPPSPTPAAPPAAVPMSPRLRVLEAREALATLQMRLLYWAALRTEVRIRLLEEAGKLARTDAVAAELALARFADELRRVRGERQLDRLEYEAGLLRSALEAAERGATAPGADRSGLPAARAEVQRALLALNAVVSEGVRLRREVDRAEPAKEARPAASDPGVSTSEELFLYRDPAGSALDVGYARGALEHVGRFDAGLVAANHAAVVRRIDALRARQRAVAPREDLRRRYDVALAEAEGAIGRFAALAPLRTQWMVEGFRRDLEQYRTDFDDVRKGLDAERTRLEEQLAALAGLRDALLRQGVRSFGVQRRPRGESRGRRRRARGRHAHPGRRHALAHLPRRRRTPASSWRGTRQRSRAWRWSPSCWPWACGGCDAASTPGSPGRRCGTRASRSSARRWRASRRSPPPCARRTRPRSRPPRRPCSARCRWRP